MAWVNTVSTPHRRNVEAVLLMGAIGVAMGAYALVGLGVNGSLPSGLMGYSIGFTIVVLILHLTLRLRAPHADPLLLPITVALNGIGLAVIYRCDLAYGSALSNPFAPRQLLWSAIGAILAAAVLWLLPDHRRLRNFTYISMLGGIILLLLPLAPGLGANINGARIWIRVAGMSFQPGEVAKILLAVFFAGYLVIARDSLTIVGPTVFGIQFPRARDLGPLLVVWAVSLGVLIFEKDLGTSLLFFGMFVGMLYVATERVSWALIGVGLFVGGAFAAWSMFAHVQTRVAIWLDPFNPENADRSYQLVQGMYGLANGGIFGAGLGGGHPQYTPYPQSDFIIASIGEELGLVGVFAILSLYLLIVARGLRTAIGVRDDMGKLLVTGLSFTFALQVFIVVGGVFRIIPLTGLTTPFLASGGSSMVANWIMIALLLRVSDSARRPAPDMSPLSATAERSVVGA